MLVTRTKKGRIQALLNPAPDGWIVVKWKAYFLALAKGNIVIMMTLKSDTTWLRDIG